MRLIHCPWCCAVQPENECFLGALGALKHYCCRYCGGAWSRKVRR